MCHKCPNCCSRSTCRGQTTPVLGKMGSPGGKSESGNSTEGGLCPPLPVQTQLGLVTFHHKQLCKPTQTCLPSGSITTTFGQERSRTSSESELSRVLQQTISSTQTQQPVETYPGPQQLKPVPEHESFKMETPEIIRTSLQTGEWVTSIDFKDEYFHIPIHAQSKKYMRFHVQDKSYQFKALPFRLSTAPIEFTVVAKIDGFTEGYKDPPVPRRLVGQSQVPPYLSPGYTNLGSPLSRAWLVGEQGEISTGSKTDLRLRRLPVPPEGG